ncbi:unnamed protein product [Linum trigynum]|uniref:Uncharacterized protein n=1 Tax=Linum trigynum TaxID=586398 RepID=A0AAV2E2L5_9ROSI
MMHPSRFCLPCRRIEEEKIPRPTPVIRGSSSFSSFASGNGELEKRKYVDLESMPSRRAHPSRRSPSGNGELEKRSGGVNLEKRSRAFY